MQPLDEEGHAPWGPGADDQDEDEREGRVPLTSSDSAQLSYESERRRVQEVVTDYEHQQHESERERRGGEPDEHAVPTEYLQEDLDVVLVLPPDFAAGKLASLVAGRPKRLLTWLYGVALVLALWVALTPGDKFSADERLFTAATDPDVKRVYDLGNPYMYPLNPADRQLGQEAAAAAAAASAAARARALGQLGHDDVDPRDHMTCCGADFAVPLTIVYERRGSGLPDSMLNLRQLKAMRDLEHELAEWAAREGTCWADGVDAATVKSAYVKHKGSPLCHSPDSILNYLYPHVEGVPRPGGSATLHFDGRMELTDGGCSLPPFSGDDVTETTRWLQARVRWAG